MSNPSPMADLREKMARILGETMPKAETVTRGELPFVCEETELGPLYVRSRRLAVDHRMGRVEIATASKAAPGILALLALDPRLSGCDPRRALYLDTETTGLLGGAGTVAFLVGLAFFEEGGRSLVIEQLFLRQLGEEAPILDRIARRMRDASMLVSYNGKSFDLPLLRTRAVMSRMPALVEKPHLDLVHIARRLHRRRIGACSLSSVEQKVLGFFREGDIPSNEIAARYAHYLRTRDHEAIAAVIEHNDWDVVAMAALVGLYGEPLEGLSPEDLAMVAQTLKRAGSLDLAGDVAEAAVLSGGGGEALRARGEIAKARGDKARALLDFAEALEELDDPTLRLELAKLYEHHAHDPLSALEMVLQGTGEGPEATERRRVRLEAKQARLLRRA